MSSETKFRCCGCREEIVSTSNPAGFQGWCFSLKIGTRFITHNLYESINGPHICSDCVEEIVNHPDSKWQTESTK